MHQQRTNRVCIQMRQPIELFDRQILQTRENHCAHPVELRHKETNLGTVSVPRSKNRGEVLLPRLAGQMLMTHCLALPIFLALPLNQAIQISTGAFRLSHSLRSGLAYQVVMGCHAFWVHKPKGREECSGWPGAGFGSLAYDSGKHGAEKWQDEGACSR